ncbi:MAG: GNAT family N-acetyltransferase [Bradyrhizobium sp.]|nr:GNAT family N-acetyltransferase [Bradyrhizobium sp.]
MKRALTPETLPGWKLDAIASLLAKASPAAMGETIQGAAFAHLAADRDAIVGLILCRQLRFLNLLVVEPTLQRRGIGSQLLRCMLRHLPDAAPDLSVVEVNATEYSLPFYRGLGFYPLSEFVEFDGCRFARLGYWRKNPLLPRSEC